MSRIKIITVVVNFQMFNRFFRDNPHLRSCDVVCIDNRTRNRGLPAVYNEVIEESLGSDRWLFFVHEDFEIKSDLNIVMGLSRDVVYGTFGVKLSGNVPFGVGRHVVSNKDGSRPSIVGVEVSSPVSVQTLDCQSILVHASLFADRPKLRFDENLTFDLYAEDFGLNAVENFNIDLQVFPLDVQHYSYGNITERYVAGLEYLARKYPTVAVPGSCSFIGGRAHELEEHFQYQIPADPRYRSRFARASARVKSWIASAIRKV